MHGSGHTTIEEHVTVNCHAQWKECNHGKVRRTQRSVDESQCLFLFLVNTSLNPSKNLPAIPNSCQLTGHVVTLTGVRNGAVASWTRVNDRQFVSYEEVVHTVSSYSNSRMPTQSFEQHQMMANLFSLLVGPSFDVGKD